MWQIGIDVLPGYRRQGIACALTSCLALKILEHGKVPFYCAAWSNIRSVRNAIKSGRGVKFQHLPADFPVFTQFHTVFFAALLRLSAVQSFQLLAVHFSKLFYFCRQLVGDLNGRHLIRRRPGTFEMCCQKRQIRFPS